MIRGLIILLLLIAPFCAQAQETRLRLAESGTVRRMPDQAVATLRAEARAPTAAAAQAAVNRTMTAALEQANRVTGIRATTGRYATHRGTDPRSWTTIQQLILIGDDPAALADLVGNLQSQGLALGDLGWRLSDALTKEARDEATRLAISQIQARALLVAEALQLRVGQLRDLAIDAPLDQPIMPSASMARSAAYGAQPATVPDEVPVTVRATADVILTPR